MMNQAEWVLASGKRYFEKGAPAIAALPLPRVDASLVGRAVILVDLPAWAADLGIGGRLLVDAASLADGEGEQWRRCNWLTAAFAHLDGAFERRHEAAHGPAHSYAMRLSDAPGELFDHAWTNRIFLFLRRYAAREAGVAEDALFGPAPKAEILLTHDIDAIRKTPEIRLKQGVFHGFNALRAMQRGEPAAALRRAREGFRFAARAATFETLAEVRALESERGLRSVLHFYAGPSGLKRMHPARMLLDPSYDIRAPYLLRELRALSEGGWTIGLHQSTAAWRDVDAMARERAQLAEASGLEPVHCRQHWLRFSWATTWAAQERAGLRVDSTLGFNDRMGFRNGAALRFNPRDASSGRILRLEAMPMIFMDSHFYDYMPMSPDQRRAEMARWIGEVRAVGGEATVNWHTHTIGDAYGWDAGYRELIALLAT